MGGKVTSVIHKRHCMNTLNNCICIQLSCQTLIMVITSGTRKAYNSYFVMCVVHEISEPRYVENSVQLMRRNFLCSNHNTSTS